MGGGKARAHFGQSVRRGRGLCAKPSPRMVREVGGSYVSLKVRARGLRTVSSKRLHRRLTNSVLKMLSRKLSAASSWRMKKSSCRVLGEGREEKHVRVTGEAGRRADI